MWRAVVECLVFVMFVVGTTVAPLWLQRRAKGGGAGAAGAGAGAAGASKREYVFAGGGVSVGAMILSLSRGTLGVRSFLGFPAEMAYRGAGMWETLYGMVLALPLLTVTLLPLYFSAETTSVYQYLEMRFGSPLVRRLAAGTFLARQVLNLAVTVRAPCLALHAAAAAPPAATAAALAAAAAAAAALGGLAAAIRADVIQTVSTVLLSLVFVAHATDAAGGAAAVYRANRAGGRLKFFNFTWDMRTRVDTLSAVVGQCCMSLSVFGCQQTFVQRYCALGSARRARRALLLAAPALAALFSLSWVLGAALYALYAHCDPLKLGALAAPDELLPYYVRERLSVAPGVNGLFQAILFNGALTFLVSNVNSLATVTWEDFVSALPACRRVPDHRQLLIIKVIGVVYVLIICFGSLLLEGARGVVEASLLITSATGGALLGVFALAAGVRRAGAGAAAAGALAAHATAAALVAARVLLARPPDPLLVMGVDGCDNATMSHWSPLPPQTTPAPAPHEDVDFMYVVRYIYSMSYMWYTCVGATVCVCVGAGVAACAPAPPPPPRLLHPALQRTAPAPAPAPAPTGDAA